MTLILLVGGADTGRAPMAAALLRRRLAAEGHPWVAESAGVLGHDGEPAQVEARDTMAHLGLDIGAHEARTLTDDLAHQAALVLAVDRGTALVLRARYAAAADRIATLGELAGRPRDIPDPFKMQIGAWMTYAHEIDALLGAALPRIIEMLPPTTDHRPPTTPSTSRFPRNPDAGRGLSRGRTGDHRPQTAEGERGRGGEGEDGPRKGVLHTPTTSNLQSPTTTDTRRATVERIDRLLQVVAQMPGVVDWNAARAQIEAELSQVVGGAPVGADLAAAYVGLLRAALALTTAPPSAGQLAALREEIGQLAGRIEQPAIDALAARLPTWATL
jgi:protein-tyrosine phosphatase